MELLVALIASILALVYVVFLILRILKVEKGTEKMIEIADAIHEGAMDSKERIYLFSFCLDYYLHFAGYLY